MAKESAKKIQSMTGFGRGTAQNTRFLVQIELRSVNGRFLEIRPKLSRSLLFFESRLREQIGARLRRGMVDVQLLLQWKPEYAPVPIDGERVATYAKEAQNLADRLKIESGISVIGLLRLPGSVAAEETMSPEQEQEVAVLAGEALETALDELLLMRSREGERLGAVLERELAQLLSLHQKVYQLRGTANEQLHRRLLERVGKLTQEFSLQTDPNRLVQELAFYADRSDVTEELDRLGSHMDQFKKAISSQSPEQVGKRCDFLLQEIGREINTIGAKVDLLELSQTVVDMKLVSEKLREQVQNLE